MDSTRQPPDQLKWHDRISVRLTAAVIAAIVIPMLIFYFVSLNVVEQARLRDARYDLSILTSHGGAMLQNIINQIPVNMEPSPYDPDPAKLTTESLQTYLVEYLRRRPLLNGAAFVTENGQEKARAGRNLGFTTGPFPDRAGTAGWAAVRKGEVYYGQPYIGETGTIQMDIAIPYYEPRGTRNFAGAYWGIVSLSQVIERVQMVSSGLRYIYVVDDQGKVISYPKQSLVLERKNLSGLKIVAAAHALPLQSQTQMYRYMNPGGREVFGMGYHMALGWAFVAEEPVTDVYAGVNTAKRAFTIVLFASVAAGLIASIIIGRKATNSVVRTQRVAQAIGEGNFDQRIDSLSTGEIGRLQASINLMAEQLENFRRHVEDEVDILNERVAERTQSLQDAYEELKTAQAALVQSEKLSSLGQLVAGVVHDVANPLTYISYNVDAVKRYAGMLGELAEKCREAAAVEKEAERSVILAEVNDLAEEIDLAETLRSIQRLLSDSSEGLKRMQKIVTDLRDFSRLGEMVIEPADINSLIQTTLSMVSYELRRKNIKVTKDLGELPSVPCSPVKISQVLMNIIMNAIKAVSKGGNIWLASRVENAWAVISIRDDGTGIDPEIIEKIFDPFFTTRPRGEGTGLGLSVSYGIIQDHGGKLEVNSDPGKGTEFIIRLPLEQSPDYAI